MIPKITANGYALLLNALDGVGIQFSKIVVGNGEKPGDYRVLSDLQNPILSANITDITRMEKYAILRAPMLNSDVEGRLHWTELGVFAKDPAGGSDILYGYAHTDLSGDGQGISVPSYDTNMIELAHIIYVYVGEVDDVTAIIAQSSEYASAEALRSHTANTSNPHKVDAADVGLGNVPNVTPENQKPVFSNTIASVTIEDDGTKSLPNIQNGDVMGLILQKIRSAISAFVSHLNDKNPHGLVANDVGAAASTHYHSASDINKGTLSLIRGGTGGSTAEEARTNIGAAADNHKHNAEDVGAAAKEHTHNYAGASTAGGAANSAKKLSTARKVTVDLGSETGADFDGSKEITPGVKGILPMEHGGLGASTPEEARKNLGVITLDEIPNLHVWKKYSGDPSKPKETATSYAQISWRDPDGTYVTGGTVTYADGAKIEEGEVVLDGETKSLSYSSASSDVSALLGKYVKSTGSSLIEDSYDGIYYIPEDATLTPSSTGLSASNIYRLSVPGYLGYVASKERNGYPAIGTHNDGCWYVYHKQIGD